MSAPKPDLESEPNKKTIRSQHQSTKPKRDQKAIFFIHQNINHFLKKYNRLLIKDY